MKTELHAIGRLVFSCCALACAGEAELPELPSLTQLSREYDQPTAELASSRIRGVIDATPQLQSLLAAFRSTETVLDGVDEAQKPASQQTGEGVRLRGSLHATVRCPGDFTRPNYDEALNGSILLTLGVQRSAILRSVGGNARQCRLNGSLAGLSTGVTLDGPVAFDLGQDIPLGQSRSRTRWLIAVGGSISVDDVRFEDVSARIGSGAVEYLQRLPDGTSVVLSASSSGITLRDAESTWSCDTRGGACERE
jgi:hypothetical protein